jgi:cytochrome c oxidase cbb3-type subunit 2
MPAYAWLNRAPANAEDIEAKLKALRILGVPYSADEISRSRDDLKGKSEMDALVAYLQVLGTAVKPAGR